MDDLIYRSAALNAIDCWHIDFNSMDGAKVQMDCWRTIKELPAADAVPVVRARWIEHEDSNGDSYYTCSACGCDWTTIDGTPAQNNMRFCPECGARMDGERRESE